MRVHNGPRISSAPLRAAQHPGHAFLILEVRAQRRWRDPDAALKHGNCKVSRGLSGVKMKQGAIAAFP